MSRSTFLSTKKTSHREDVAMRVQTSVEMLHMGDELVQIESLRMLDELSQREGVRLTNVFKKQDTLDILAALSKYGGIDSVGSVAVVLMQLTLENENFFQLALECAIDYLGRGICSGELIQLLLLLVTQQTSQLFWEHREFFIRCLETSTEDQLTSNVVYSSACVLVTLQEYKHFDEGQTERMFMWILRLNPLLIDASLVLQLILFVKNSPKVHEDLWSWLECASNVMVSTEDGELALDMEVIDVIIMCGRRHRHLFNQQFVEFVFEFTQPKQKQVMIEALVDLGEYYEQLTPRIVEFVFSVHRHLQNAAMKYVAEFGVKLPEHEIRLLMDLGREETDDYTTQTILQVLKQNLSYDEFGDYCIP